MYPRFTTIPEEHGYRMDHASVSGLKGSRDSFVDH